jgi:hypothetical protein
MKAGEVYENPVTGERVVVRVGAQESCWLLTCM